MFMRRIPLSIKERTRQAISPPKGHKRVLHYFLWRLKRLPGTPNYIARGFAIGVAVNFWPVLFTHLVIGYILCRVIKGDLIAMFIGTLLGNPWTFAVVYPLMYKIGKIMMGLKFRHHNEIIDSADDVWHRIWPIESWHSLAVAFHEILLPMMIGGFLLGLPCTLAAFYLVRNFVRVYQGQRRKHILRNFIRTEHEIEDAQ